MEKRQQPFGKPVTVVKGVEENEISSKKDNEKSVSVKLKSGFMSKFDGLKSDVLLKGITKRWATNTLLITALILLVLVAASVLFFTSYLCPFYSL